MVSCAQQRAGVWSQQLRMQPKNRKRVTHTHISTRLSDGNEEGERSAYALVSLWQKIVDGECVSRRGRRKQLDPSGASALPEPSVAEPRMWYMSCICMVRSRDRWRGRRKQLDPSGASALPEPSIAEPQMWYMSCIYMVRTRDRWKPMKADNVHGCCSSVE